MLELTETRPNDIISTCGLLMDNLSFFKITRYRFSDHPACVFEYNINI